MNDPAADWTFWKWVGGGIVSMLSGAAVGGWVARGVFASLQERLVKVELKQDACQAALQETISSAVKSAITDHALQSAAALEEIRTSLAVIIDRTERRKEDVYPAPHGERRDQ